MRKRSIGLSVACPTINVQPSHPDLKVRFPLNRQIRCGLRVLTLISATLRLFIVTDRYFSIFDTFSESTGVGMAGMRTTRNPMIRLLSSGRQLARAPARQPGKLSEQSAKQSSPRTIRLSPDSGPVGSAMNCNGGGPCQSEHHSATLPNIS